MHSHSGTTPPRDSHVQPSVLVVDDVDATRQGLAELLRLRGYQPYEARDGEEAMNVLRDHPDTGVIVLDVAMPGSDGYWFREQQLRTPALAHIPVIVFTGAEQERLGDLQVAEILRKPLAVDALLMAVQRHAVQDRRWA